MRGALEGAVEGIGVPVEALAKTGEGGRSLLVPSDQEKSRPTLFALCIEPDESIPQRSLFWTGGWVRLLLSVAGASGRCAGIGSAGGAVFARRRGADCGGDLRSHKEWLHSAAK